MSIVLVGNGPSVLGSSLGKRIDEFSHVVRFNNFQLKGYEEDVGTKTTILARRSCDDVKWHDPFLFSHVLNFVTYCKWTGGMVAVSRTVNNFYGIKCVTVNPDECKLAGELMELDQPHKEWASIGALTIAYFADLQNQFKSYTSFIADSPIYICGFDHLEENNKGRVEHYFPKATKDAKYHNSEKEKAYVEKLIEQGKVIRL